MKKLKQTLSIVKSIAIQVTLLGVFAIVVIGVIAFARGYRLTPQEQIITPTGIIAAYSSPKAAKIYIDDELKGVTDQNISLPPGTYRVDIKREGYSDWTKQITLRGEVVMTADAILFPKNPSLSPITNLGIVKAVRIGNGGDALLFTDSGNVEKDGIYLYDSATQTFSLLPQLRTILLKENIPFTTDLSEAQVTFSPDYKQVIVEIPNIPTSEDVQESTIAATIDQGLGDEQTIQRYPYTAYLLSLQEENEQLFDITLSKQNLMNIWSEQHEKEVKKSFEIFPQKLRSTARSSMRIISISPDETKILYEATQEANLTEATKHQLVGRNQTPEERTITPNKVYVYDKKEDRNYPLPFSLVIKDHNSNPMAELITREGEEQREELSHLYKNLRYYDNQIVLWHPNSKNLIALEQGKLVAYDYDGENRNTIYSGPFEDDFFAVTNDGRLLVVTTLNPDETEQGDLYEVGIK